MYSGSLFNDLYHEDSRFVTAKPSVYSCLCTDLTKPAGAREDIESKYPPAEPEALRRPLKGASNRKDNFEYRTRNFEPQKQGHSPFRNSISRVRYSHHSAIFRSISARSISIHLTNGESVDLGVESIFGPMVWIVILESPRYLN